MPVTRRLMEAGDLRRLQDLCHELWLTNRARLGFETSFGTLAWERGGEGRARVFEVGTELVAWARLTPGYDRIRRMGVWDVAPPSLTWVVDWRRDGWEQVLATIVEWAASRSDTAFTTSHASGDVRAAAVLHALGYRNDPTEPFGIYLHQGVNGCDEPAFAGHRFTTMAELDDLELRAAAHRVAWEGSTRSADDVRATMAQWPYRADLDIVALDETGAPAGSATVWYDESYEYGELEPVGVSAHHRSRGLGAAMLRFALARLRAAGAEHAVVGARGDDDYPVPRHLYRSVGFELFTSQQIVRRS